SFHSILSESPNQLLGRFSRELLERVVLLFLKFGIVPVYGILHIEPAPGIPRHKFLNDAVGVLVRWQSRNLAVLAVSLKAPQFVLLLPSLRVPPPRQGEPGIAFPAARGVAVLDPVRQVMQVVAGLPGAAP